MPNPIIVERGNSHAGWSTVIRGTTLDEEIVECSQLSFRNQRVPFPVTSCSGYGNRNQASLQEIYVLEKD